MRKTIVYAGGFVLPAGNASAQRVLETSRLIASLGYEVVLVGQLPSGHEAEIEGFRSLNIHGPDGTRRWPYYKKSGASLLAAIEKVGREKIHAVIAYNYPATPLAQLIAHGRRHGIHVIAECADWYSWEGRNIPQNVRRLIATEIRIRLLTRLAGNVICTSHWGARTFRGANVHVQPWVIDETTRKWNVAPAPRTPRRRFVYVGSPGRGLVKDHLHLAIAAFANLARAGADFDFQVAGVTADVVRAAFPALASDIAALGERITFHGRLPHPEAVALLRSADFSLFVRPDTRVSRFGFPTKLAEAFACGVPAITNATSDIPLYVHDGDNGILLAGPDVGSIEAGLSRALALSDEAMAAMKARCRADNPFAPARWAGPLGAFLERLR